LKKAALVSLSLLAWFATVLAPAETPAEPIERVAPAATVTIAAAGDIARPNHPGNNQKQTAKLITGMHPDKVLMLGDAQYEHGEYAQFQRSYDPTWGAFKSITAPILGNHEYETRDAAGYFKYFAAELSGLGARASDANAGYYSFNVGDWHIAALNSNCHHANCGAEAAWLRSDMTSDHHTCELVMFHDPGRRDFVNAAAAVRADLVLTGHHHTYERWDRAHGLDLRLFVVGTGGESSGPPNPHADGRFKGYGVLRLDLSATGYSWRFIAVGGQTKDSGSATCHN
jgi:acid phosphatase type 7